MKFKVTIQPSDKFSADNLIITAPTIYHALSIVEDILKAAGASPCDILTIEKVITKEEL